MADRRSGVDLRNCSAGWAVVYGDRLIGLHPTREEAVRAAGEESKRILARRGESRALVDPATYPRLRSRRRVRHQNEFAYRSDE